MTQGWDGTACPFHSACPQVPWAQCREGDEGDEGAGQENLPGGSGRGGMRSSDTCIRMKRLPLSCGHHQAPLSHGPQSHAPASLRPFCSQLDHCLQEVSPCYKSLRFRGSVGPARVHLVGRGAFRELRAALAACPSSPFPPEMPRVLRHRHLAECLQRRVLS